MQLSGHGGPSQTSSMQLLMALIPTVFKDHTKWWLQDYRRFEIITFFLEEWSQ
jgi:hypothetical protein